MPSLHPYAKFEREKAIGREKEREINAHVVDVVDDALVAIASNIPPYVSAAPCYVVVMMRERERKRKRERVRERER